tara:strand:+ start:5041 stop:5172 length:132 start_codon:yes stop_codon:yes gene_type:complete
MVSVQAFFKKKSPKKKKKFKLDKKVARQRLQILCHLALLKETT